MFHADHGSKAASGGTIADDTLSDARLAMRSQTGLSGQRISATPQLLLVRPAQETVAEKWLATIAAAKAADLNPFSGALSLVIEPRLSSVTRRCISADPAEIEGLEYAYLAGGEGPQIETEAGWDVGRGWCRGARHPNGPTLKQALDEIYSDGRSRTIHGTNVKLGHDWSETRGLAEQFARLCLLLCIDWAAQNSSSDDPKQLSR